MKSDRQVLPVAETPGTLGLGFEGTAPFSTRLAHRPQGRLNQGVKALIDSLDALVRDLRLTSAEFRLVLDYLTAVGHASDARRQEWVLLADALGLSMLVEDLNNPRPAGCTPNTVAGPFYRADAPMRDNGTSISLDRKGEPLQVNGRVLSLDGTVLTGALVEVWQPNGEGKYENQEPDLQPENNLRGRFRTDAQGRFSFSSVMPGGYALPSDGPVGQLMGRLGLGLSRPAHIHFRALAAGHERLTTHIFDRADPAIDRDAIFGVKPELLADFLATTVDGAATGRAIDIDLVLCPLRQG